MVFLGKLCYSGCETTLWNGLNKVGLTFLEHFYFSVIKKKTLCSHFLRCDFFPENWNKPLQSGGRWSSATALHGIKSHLMEISAPLVPLNPILPVWRNWALDLLRYLMYQENLLSTLFYESQTLSLSQNDRKSLKQKCLLSCNSNKRYIHLKPIHPLSCNLKDVKEW